MTHKISKIWITVSLLWLCALLLNYRNISVMNHVIMTRQRMAISQMIRQYTLQHTAGISNIMTTREMLYQIVDSPKMGVFSTEQELKKMIEICDLRAIAVNASYNGIGNEKVPIDIHMRGNLKNSLKWIDTIQRTYPYIQTAHIKMSVLRNSNQVETKISLYYKFIQQTSDKNG